jgi:hypothetical protein
LAISSRVSDERRRVGSVDSRRIGKLFVDAHRSTAEPLEIESSADHGAM